MIVIQFREDLLHDGFAEKSGFCGDTELVTITADGSHLAVIQIYDLAVSSHQSFLLLLEIFRIDSRSGFFSFLCH